MDNGSRQAGDELRGPVMTGSGAEQKLIFEVGCFRLCPRPWKNASYDGDDGDAFLGTDGGGVGRPIGACGLSEAIRF